MESSRDVIESLMRNRPCSRMGAGASSPQHAARAFLVDTTFYTTRPVDILDTGD